MFRKLLILTVGISLAIGCSQVLEKRANLIKAPTAAQGATYAEAVLMTTGRSSRGQITVSRSPS